jgi:hypothetical protein
MHAALRDRGSSVCGIGSPRACYAAELMLAEMLRTRPGGCVATADSDLAFWWCPLAPTPFPSAFRATIAELKRLDSALANDLHGNRVWGVLKVKDQLFVLRRTWTDTTWTAHGVVFVQRRPNNRTWMVIAGLSGPATFGAALAVSDDQTGGAPTDLGAGVGVRWDVVEVTVNQEVGGQGDPRSVADQRIVSRGVL